MLWLHLHIYEVAISGVEKFERIMNKAVRKWLGVPRCLSTVDLHGKGILESAMTSLEFKCAKKSLEMSQSMDPAVKNTAPTVKARKKWNPQEVVQHAQGS